MGPSPATAAAGPAGYLAARERLAHRFTEEGVVDVTGADRVSFLQGQLTQDVSDLRPGECREALGLTPKGKLLFVARVVGLEDRLRLIVPPALRVPVLDHLRKYAVFAKVEAEDRSGSVAPVALYGPGARDLPAPPGSIALPSRGELTAEWLVPADDRARVAAALAAARSEEVSDETAEILRVEAGRPEFGRDMDGNNLPDEVGFSNAISITKGCYVGQEVVARLRTYGRINRRLVSFRFPDGLVEPGEALRRPDETEPSRTEAGRVTSAVTSPSAGRIGLGFAFRDVPEGARLVADRPPERGAIVSEIPAA